MNSARRSRIEHAFGREALREAILHTVAASERREGVFVRYWLSAGRGDFGIAPSPVSAGVGSFFCIVHEYCLETHRAPAGVSEVVVDVPRKPALLEEVKSNNYLLNALQAMEAKERGGYLGLQLDEAGYVTDSSVGSVAIVSDEGELVTPPFDGLLPSTTVTRALALAEEVLVPSGVLKGVRQRPLHRDECDAAREMVGLGGGDVVPILKLDGRVITEAPGPIYKELARVVHADFENEEFLDDVPYELYAEG